MTEAIESAAPGVAWDQPLLGKRVVVGVGGSISAYRACDVIRQLMRLGARVRVAPTKAAAAFVTPLTFEALSGAPVLGGVLELEAGRIPHVEAAYEADAVVVAPASADLLARLAHGFADETLLALALSFRGPLVLAPAMETRMWDHPATRANVASLRERGAVVVAPGEGALASGREGVGRLAAVDDIVECVVFSLTTKDLAGVRVLVTAGPTVEDVDPVRFLTNRSSGKMGVALAQRAARRGALVDLVHGPLRIPVPTTPGLSAHAVRSANDMATRVLALIDDDAAVDAVLMCAAVADATPAHVAAQKIKKQAGALASIALVPTVDILQTLGTRSTSTKRPVLVGFAAETTDVLAHAREKLVRKRCDLICANDVTAAGAGFDADTNRLHLVRAGTAVPQVAVGTKGAVADRVLDEVRLLLGERA